MESILDSIKKLLGMEADYRHFDTDVIMHINNVFMTLHQLGVGPSTVFRIQNNLDTWDKFLGESTDFESVKTYMYLKVKMVFDPPTNSFTIQAYEKEIERLEWRLNVQAENNKEV